MSQLDASSEELSRTESVAERADIYRVAMVLLNEYDWSDGNEPHPDDALRLAHFLAEGLDE